MGLFWSARAGLGQRRTDGINHTHAKANPSPTPQILHKAEAKTETKLAMFVDGMTLIHMCFCHICSLIAFTWNAHVQRQGRIMRIAMCMV